MFLEGFVIMNDWTLKGVWKYEFANKMKVMKMVQKCSKFYCLDNIQVSPPISEKPISAFFLTGMEFYLP